jgi:hypothetical protein
MRPERRARASAIGGVFTRRDAVACGYTERELKTLTGHRGAWVVVRRGCYTQRALWDALDLAGRYLLEVRAASLVLRSGAVVSHCSAAAALGMPLRPRWRELVHVTRAGVHGSRTESGVKHHLGLLGDVRILTVDGRVRGRSSGCGRGAAARGHPPGAEAGAGADDVLAPRDRCAGGGRGRGRGSPDHRGVTAAADGDRAAGRDSPDPVRDRRGGPATRRSTSGSGETCSSSPAE